MKRRGFLRAAGAAAAGGVALAGCTETGENRPRGGPGGQGGQGGAPPADVPVRPAVQRQEADEIVTDTATLIEEARSGSGRVIWVEGEHELTESFATSNWIASGRGQEQETTATLYTDIQAENSEAYRGGEGDGMITLEDAGRLTGVQLIGPARGAYDHPRYDGYYPYPEGDRSERFHFYARHHARGVTILGQGCSVDNCEISHWPTQGIVVGDSETAVNPAIHHNSIHNCMLSSAGYCVDIKRGHPQIIECYMNATRHAICGFGYADCSYTLENLTFGPDHSAHIVDMHGLHNNLDTVSEDPSSEIYRYRAGGQMNVSGCEFQNHRLIEEEGGGVNEAVHVRGVPAEGFHFQNNVLPWEDHREAINQTTLPDDISMNDFGLAGIFLQGNTFGASV